MIPAPGSPDAPKYWMYESSGVLQPVVRKYLRGEELSFNELGVFRAYLRQWVQSPAWDQNPHQTREGKAALNGLRSRITAIDGMERLREWLAAAVEQGLDPL
jgi:hypothetical protein